jgi:DNA-binding response OmpR family regulator
VSGIVGGLHALCLDDDRAILDGMQALLTRWQMTCDICSNVEEARIAVSRRRPDLILADYHLGTTLNGLAALDLLCGACAPAVPGALITADAGSELKTHARERGYALLRKPVKPAALRALIAQLGRASASASSAQPAA